MELFASLQVTLNPLIAAIRSAFDWLFTGVFEQFLRALFRPNVFLGWKQLPILMLIPVAITLILVVIKLIRGVFYG